VPLTATSGEVANAKKVKHMGKKFERLERKIERSERKAHPNYSRGRDEYIARAKAGEIAREKGACPHCGRMGHHPDNCAYKSNIHHLM
jgi:hypothetical protein